MADKSLKLTVITPSRAVLDEQAVSVVVPAFDGELGVMPGHADLVALLGNGAMRYTHADGSRGHLALRGGFLQVKDNVVTVLTPESARPAELDPAVIGEEMKAIQTEVAHTDAEFEQKDARIAWAKARLRIAEAARGEHQN